MTGSVAARVWSEPTTADRDDRGKNAERARADCAAAAAAADWSRSAAIKHSPYQKFDTKRTPAVGEKKLGVKWRHAERRGRGVLGGGGLCRRLPLIWRRLAITNSCNENIAPARHWPPLINWCNYCLLKLGLRRPGWSGGQRRGPRWATIEPPTRYPADVDFELTYKLQLPALVGVAVQWDFVRHSCSGLDRVNIRNQTLQYITCDNVYWVLFQIHNV